MTEPFLRMTGIRKAFPGVIALKGVDLSVDEGEIHALVGENGAGKSTLLKILGGAQSPDTGAVWIGGRPVRLRTPHDAMALGIRVIYQELVLAPHLSAAENIYLGHMPRRGGVIDWRAIRAGSRQLMAEIGVEINLGAPVGRLSIAQQQLVSIAHALTQQSRLLVLDEPSAVLSGHELALLFTVIRRLQARGVSIIYVSHRLDEIFALASRVTVLRDGQVVGVHPVDELDTDTLIQMMTGRQLEQSGLPDVVPGEIALEVQGLSRGRAFRDIGLQVRQGEILGIAGLVGSGRTEVLRAIQGADRPERGIIKVFGRHVTIVSPRHALRLGIGLVPEDRKGQGLLLQRSVRENATVSSLARFGRWGFINTRREKRAVQSLRDALRIITPHLRQRVMNLSGGNQQKVVLARWLSSRCRILLLDEPTRGVDVGAKAEIYRLMSDFVRDGMAIVMVSSDIQEILTMSNRVLVLRRGQIVGAFSGASLTEEHIMRAALLGDEGVA